MVAVPRARLAAATLVVAGLTACGGGTAAAPATTTAPRTTISPDAHLAADFPIAHTPAGGYGERTPDAVIPTCTEPVVAGAPKLAGLWVPKTAERGGVMLTKGDPLLGSLERIEQCGDRVVITSGGVIHDMRADGTEAHGVHDVAADDHRTPVTLTATYDGGALVLRRPDGTVEETHRLEGPRLVRTRGDTTVGHELFARYGTPNISYIQSWTPATEHGPMWALNLIKYRPKADYRDGRPSNITGAQADELYNPLGPLAAIGARIVVVGDVTAELVGDATTWDRIAIAQYPTRPAFLALQSAPGFTELHAHKEAGVDHTIVNASFPEPGPPPAEAVASAVDSGNLLLLEVVADATTPRFAGRVDTTPIGRFKIENVLIGDHRSWAEARWDMITPAVAAKLAAAGTTKAGDRYVVIIKPIRDILAQSLRENAARTSPAKPT